MLVSHARRSMKTEVLVGSSGMAAGKRKLTGAVFLVRNNGYNPNMHAALLLVMLKLQMHTCWSTTQTASYAMWVNDSNLGQEKQYNLANTARRCKLLDEHSTKIRSCCMSCRESCRLQMGSTNYNVSTPSNRDCEHIKLLADLPIPALAAAKHWEGMPSLWSVAILIKP